MPSVPVHEHFTTLAQTPSLIVSGGPYPTVGRGTVLLVHGLDGSKEAQRTEAHSLARRGFLAVAIDAVGHGARRYSDFAERFSPERAEGSFFEVVQQTAEELPGVLADLKRRGWVRSHGLGAFGFSMGGAILFGAINSGCSFDAVSTVAASPRWRHVPESPHEHLERFFPTPLLVQTAAADTIVPPADARVFCAALAPRYASTLERLRYIEHAGEDHLFSKGAWSRVWGEVLDWFERFLIPPHR